MADSKLKQLEQEIAKAKELEKIYSKVKNSAMGRISAAQQSLEVIRQQEVLIGKQTKSEEWLAAKAAERGSSVAAVVKTQQQLLAAKEKESAIIQHNLQLENQKTTSMRDSLAAAKDLSKTLGDSFKGQNAVDLKKYIGMAGQLGDVFKGGKTSVLSFVTSLGKNVLLNVLSTVIGEILELVLGTDKLTKNFRKGTLASTKMAAQLDGVHRSMIEMNVSMEETGAAYTSLYGGFTDFTKLAANEQTTIARTALTFEKLGVGSETYSKGMEMATTSLSMSLEQAEHSMRDITTFSQELQLDAGKTVAAFAAAGPQLAKFGTEGTQVFKELARISKITGLEIDTLLRTTSKFDTFEGAADQAGKLNAALGGNFVNAMDLMMETDPGKRFEMIRDSITDAGLSFEDMSYYQKQYFAEAAGLESVDQLSKMMRGNMDEGADATKKNAESLAELQATAYDLIPIGQKLMLIFKSLFKDVDANKWAAHLNFVVGLIAQAVPAAILKVKEGYEFIKLWWAENKGAWIGPDGFLQSLSNIVPIVKTIWHVIKSWGSALGAAFDVLKAYGELFAAIFMSANPMRKFRAIQGVMAAGDEFDAKFAAAETATESGGKVISNLAMETAAKGRAAADTLGAGSIADMAKTAGNVLEVAKQTVSIELGGKKLADYVVEVIGEKIRDVSLTGG